MNRKLWCLDLSGGSVPQGRHAALMAVKFGMEVDSSMPYFTSICAGIGVWGAENWKFYQILENKHLTWAHPLHSFY